MSMTWREFKDYIESNGIKDEDEILYIDVEPLIGNEILIRRDEKGLAIFD